MAEVLVHNLHGTKDRLPKDGAKSWLAWWTERSGETPFWCSNCDCFCTAEVGAHVQKDGSKATDRWYIVPLCKGCNSLSTSFEVSEDDLVEVTG